MPAGSNENLKLKRLGVGATSSGSPSPTFAERPWKHECDVVRRSFSSSHIDVLITKDADGLRWRCTGFYGASEEGRLHESWDLLRRLNDMSLTPWLVIGDFNEIMYSFEKSEGRVRPTRQMMAFCEVIEDCGLSDIRDYCAAYYAFIFRSLSFATKYLGCGQKLRVMCRKSLDGVLGEILEKKLATNVEADKKEIYWEQHACANWLKNDESILQGMSRCIDEATNNSLLKEQSHEKVFIVVKSTSPLKAVGEDGLGAIFNQRFWNLIGSEVSVFCIGVRRGDLI
ncbi:hypothetical protein F3Y22_tig00001478pilonHSYRG00462 [Hibiscus syriacus]|uniref:Reverse transcriptase n=1 Tax=Hibiscus syriacus TaxID=106335 RepID=A0A6A3CVT5_HIBSY|nr:hypothetical protein F3Y22_tig00001478pilonHSYRG00462 [Hibiscus syriacus]